MRRNSLQCLVTVALLALFAGQAPAQPGPTLTTLQPGGFKEITQNLPVNIVFVGYQQGSDAGQINEADFSSVLPQTYKSLVRSYNFYGNKVFTGNAFTYNYNIKYADKAFEDALFAHFKAVGVPHPLTQYQKQYNTQINRALDLPDAPDSNLWIETKDTEKWLADNAQTKLGVDTSAYTLFFINWYGRTDFQPHVYTVSDYADVDTNYAAGILDDQTKLIGYGGHTPAEIGKTARIWFYDLSAGPEFNSGNWNVDSPSANHPNATTTDYRMPPIWEYGNAKPTYRPFTSVSLDLGFVARFIALNLLFTTSPLYDPGLAAPKLPSSIQVNYNAVPIDPTLSVGGALLPDFCAAQWHTLQPYNTFSTLLRLAPNQAKEQSLAPQAISEIVSPDLTQQFLGNNAFFRFHNDEASLLSLISGSDYQVQTFLYSVPNVLDPNHLLGQAEDDFRSGKQTTVTTFDDPIARAHGYGFTETLVHEVGHHLGMSHPHDGYDYEIDLDYDTTGDFYFVWGGDESESVMSYGHLANKFGQFDQDNMNRYMTLTYLNQANAILKPVYASPKVGQAATALRTADGLAANACSAYLNMNYAGAVVEAKLAYNQVVAAAKQIGITALPTRLPPGPHVPPLDVYRKHGRKFQDGTDYLRFR